MRCTLVHGDARYLFALNDNNIAVCHFWKVPLGDWAFGGVPFHLVDADQEELLGGDPGAPNGCIVLKGSRQPAHPDKAEGIKIAGEKGQTFNTRAKRIHFLHATCWGLSIKEGIIDKNYEVVTYRFRYKDGTTAEFVAKNDVHTRDYWIKIREFKEDLVKEARLGWAERIRDMTYALSTMWVTTWDNPHPDKELESLDIISSVTAVPVVFAVTLEE